MKKYLVTIDVLKINKDRIREWTDKDGVKHKDYSIEVIELDLHKVEKDKDGNPVQGHGWRLDNVGFVVEAATKEERANKTNTTILGSVKQFKNTTDNRDDESQAKEGSEEYPSVNINPDDIPF